MSAEVVQNGHVGASANGLSAKKKSQIQVTVTSVTESKSSSTSYRKLTTLRETTHKVSTKFVTQLDSSARVVLENTTTVDDVLDSIAAERLRYMPQDGSMLDRVLKWAVHFIGQMNLLSQAVDPFVVYSDEAAKLMWGSCLLLVQNGPDHISLLANIFGTLHNVALEVSHLMRHSELLGSIPEAQDEIAGAYADLVELTCAVSVYYDQKARGFSKVVDASEFDLRFGHYIRSFHTHGISITELVWSSSDVFEITSDPVATVREIRTFLSFQDRAIPLILSARRPCHAESTCDWFAGHLTNFKTRKNGLIVVTGGPGSGKSVLSQWIVDQLQVSVDPDDYDVIAYRIHDDINSTKSALDVVRGLLLQLLDRRIGDREFLGALSKAVKLSSSNAAVNEVEDSLWAAFHIGAKSVRKLMLVVDGVNHITGDSHAVPRLLQQLHSLVSHHSSVKVVALSRPLHCSLPQRTFQFSIEPSHVSGDIRTIVRSILKSTLPFNGLKSNDREQIADTIVDKANGSFIWAQSIIGQLNQSRTLVDILSVLQTVPTSVNDTFEHMLSTVNLKDTETRSMLAWILAAPRPLSVEEIHRLLETDTKKLAILHRVGDIQHDILHALGPLVTIDKKVVSFKYPTLRQHILSISSSVADFKNTGKFPFHLKEAHYDLVNRCLAYVKFCVHDDVEVSSVPMNLLAQTHFFEKYELLEYAARYWTTHFLSSPMAEANETYKLTAAFKQCLPDSVLFALLEGTCHRKHYTLQHARELQTMAVKIRRLVLAETSLSLLQSLVLEVRVSHELGLDRVVDCSYEAWKLSKSILGFFSSVTKATAELYMKSVQKCEIKSELGVRRREELLQYLITVTKEEHGASHELTIRYTKMLVQLYIDIKETESACKVCKELYEMSVGRYGQFSTETAEITTILFEQLQHLSKSEVVVEIMHTKYEYTVRNLEITDKRRIDSTLSIITVYEQRGDISKCDSIFFDLWQGLSTVEETSETVLQMKVNVTLAYSEYLVRHSRKEEAESIVSGLWTSIERRDSHFSQQTTVIEKITSHVKQMKWYSLAQSALKSIWSRRSETSSTTAMAIVTSLSEVVQEAVSSSTTTTTTATTKEEQLNVLREVFESVTSSTTTSKEVSVSTIQMAETISTVHVEQKQWSEAIQVYKRVLQQVWSGIETRQTVVKLTKNVEQTVKLALGLARCYFKDLQIEKAAAVYGSIFYSVIASVKIDHELVRTTTSSVIEFYETTYQFSNALSVYRDLCSAHQAQLGKAHKLTIQILYSWGDFATRCHHHEEAEKAYYEIFSSSSRKNELHVDTIRAARAVCVLYEKKQKWKEAQEVYALLWTTFIKRGKEYKLESEFVEKIYSSYLSLLETKTKSDITIIHDLASSYRETCIAIYGESHEMTYKATIRLAEISRRSEKYHEESITMYESALKHSEKYSKTVSSKETTQTTTTSTISIIKKHLAQLYSSKTETVSRAVSLYQEEFKSCISEHGYSSHVTLTSLKGLVTSYKRQNTSKATTEAIKILQSSAIGIFETETDTQKLHESARTLAQTYLELGYKEEAYSVSKTLRHRLIYESKTTQKVTISRKVIVFVVAFEEAVSQSRSYASIMADLVAEIHLYESFYGAAEKEFSQSFTCGARLLIFQRNKNWVEEAKKTEVELFRQFSTYFSLSEHTNKTSLRGFFDICVFDVVKGDHHASIVVKTIGLVYKWLQEGEFQSAYELSLMLHKFICRTDDLRSQIDFKEGFKLCKYLGGLGVNKAPDTKLQKSMLELSKTILQEILYVNRATGVRFTDMNVNETNELAILLGEQKNFEDLEFVLADLWSSRIVQKTWSSDTIISIGRRLVEARFSCGRTEQAIRLCSDLCYNIKRVWGSFDRIALELTELLSELYTASGNYRAAMALHETVLRQVIHEGRDISSAEAASTSARHAQLLKRSYQRLGGWDKEAQVYKDLYSEAHKRHGSEKSWSHKSLEHVDKWQPTGADELGIWRPPVNYGFLITSDGKKHQNQLRKISSHAPLLHLSDMN